MIVALNIILAEIAVSISSKSSCDRIFEGYGQIIIDRTNYRVVMFS